MQAFFVCVFLDIGGGGVSVVYWWWVWTAWLGLILATVAADLGWSFLVAVSLGGVAELCSFKLQNGEFWNQQNRTKTGSTMPVRGLHGQTAGFRFLVTFYRFPVFLKNRTGLSTGSRFNRSNRPVRSGF